MKTKRKPAQLRSRIQARSSACTERVLEACLHLASLGTGAPGLREEIVNAAGRTFHASVAGMFLREDDGFRSVAIAAPTEDAKENQALLSHARSFATQAIEQKRLLSFRFSCKSPDGETIYHGLAHPLVTAQSTAVLLVVRSGPFS
ncbi:MAG TPA: hypothetical protein VJW55_09400, partial [Candidatus Angelobacter sp.]|nr:hypothetical protein [Candidatus Angelobacter sp.]